MSYKQHKRSVIEICYQNKKIKKKKKSITLIGIAEWFYKNFAITAALHCFFDK